MRVVICGGGVIGAAAAYFLTRRGAVVTVVERTGVASAASGKSGGFLALDWCDGTPLQELARRSFALHAGLEEETGEDWGYRRMTTYGGSVDARGRSAGRSVQSLDWLADDVAIAGRLGTIETTAQVDPGAFTSGLMRAAEKNGAELRSVNVTGVVQSGGAAKGVEAGGEIIEGDAVVIAMGPWSMLSAEWLPVPPVFGLKGHSLLLRTERRLPAEALFLEYREESGATISPEVFPRKDGTTYVCAISTETPVPLDPARVLPDPGAIERLQAMLPQLSPALGEANVLARQACYRPVTQDGLPLIGPIPGVAGAYVATGHSVWGILNAPATGEALSELILDGTAKSLDLSPFDPARFQRKHDNRPS